MPKIIQVCIGYVTDAPETPRYQVTDEFGRLRTFWTKAEALRWKQPWMGLEEIPKPKRKKKYIKCELAPW